MIVARPRGRPATRSLLRGVRLVDMSFLCRSS